MIQPPFQRPDAGGDTFVPSGFVPPVAPQHPAFVLEPLGPEHNERDYEAWTSSVEHIRATPGFVGTDWPDPALTPGGNLQDLERHADDFRQRRGFTYTVLDPLRGDVLGCVYIYPARDDPYQAEVRSWVRAQDAHLDVELYEVVRRWLEAEWPFARFRYAPR